MATKKKSNTGFNAIKKISPELQAIIGVKESTRGGVMKPLWVYIKKHDLQDKKNGQIINPDKTLAKVMGKAPIHMTKMGGKLSDHLS